MSELSQGINQDNSQVPPTENQTYSSDNPGHETAEGTVDDGGAAKDESTMASLETQEPEVTEPSGEGNITTSDQNIEAGNSDSPTTVAGIHEGEKTSAVEDESDNVNISDQQTKTELTSDTAKETDDNAENNATEDGNIITTDTGNPEVATTDTEENSPINQDGQETDIKPRNEADDSVEDKMEASNAVNVIPQDSEAKVHETGERDDVPVDGPSGVEVENEENTQNEEIKSPTMTHQVQESHGSGDVGSDESKETVPEQALNSVKVIDPSTGPQDELPSANHTSIHQPPPPPNLRDTSVVETADSRNLINTFKEEEQTLPLSLSWTFGFNRHIGCLNLSDATRNLVMYASSHVAVLLDFKNNVQKLLLGHSNVITCIDCSADKRWLVTADKGDNSSVIVWDSYTGIPVQSIFDIPGNKGVVAVAMSQNAKFIITVGACRPQIVSVWDWTTSGEIPLCSVELAVDFGIQSKVAFCHNDDEQFVTNSDSQVIFFSWATGELKYHAPFLSDDVFNRIVGTFSQTMYQLDGIRALTGTSQGNIVVWEPERPHAKTELETPAIRKRALKLVRLQDRAITTLSFTNRYIITGDVTGAIKFYDSNLDLYSWHSNSAHMGPISSISFKYDPDFNTELLADSHDYPADATIDGNPFIVRDFLVSTKHAQIFSVHADGSSVDTILHEHDAAVHAIAVSSTKPWICIGSYAGLVKIWNFETKQCLVTRIFEKGNNIQCVTFDTLGLQLAIGMTNGTVYVLDAITLTDLVEKPFRYARDAVTHISFSHDSKYLATADADMATTVFQNDVTEGWKYLGRYRAHYKSIKDLSFGVALDTNLPRLLTLGEDRSLVEYDLMNSSKDDLRIVSIDRIEQSAVPSCLAWYPDVTKESFLVIANDEYKFKLFNTTTKMCRKTLLAPTYGSNVRKMLPLPLDKNVRDNKTRLLSYITKYKVGLQILPLDGNPHKSVAVVGHPSGISQLSSSQDGKYLFTAGGKDSCVHMWSVSTSALEAAASLGGEGLTPFYGLLEGGRDGELFAELENYFYYAQLRSQGLDTTEIREVSTLIPLEQIPFVMRALGFYPSEQEVEDMLNEVKFSEYVKTGQYVSEINLGDFIKLYVNHRPACGLTPDEIEKAFNTLSRVSREDENIIGKQELYNILQRRGEHMTEHELSHCLGTLLGVTSEGGSTEYGLDHDNEILSKYLDDILPDRVSALMFSEEILGLSVNETHDE